MKEISGRKLKVLDDFNRMKTIANYYIARSDWEHALQTLFFASGFMYTMNQLQYDDELENMVTSIAKKLVKVADEYNRNEKVVLYYDSFGSVERGLSKIYLDALVDSGFEVKYVTMKNRTETLQSVSERVGIGNVFCIQGRTYEERIVSLVEIVQQSCAFSALLYMTPDDVVATGVFSLFKRKLNRYLINLTDHAFWLGKSACDIVINFREFGGKVCRDRRKFDEEKLVFLPYYPDEIESEFEGLDFEDNSGKLIFSGGALYKTDSKDNKYYKLVESILSTFPNTNFIYLGNGKTQKIRRLIRKFPGRAIYATERHDFFEIMKHATLYLSTYPYNGGLMTQYALLANKIPITLTYAGIEKELSILNEQSFWNYESFETCVEEVGKFLRDDEYRRNKEKQLSHFLVSKQQFAEELQNLLANSVSPRKITYNEYEFEGFWKIPLENYVGIKYHRLFFRKDGIYMLKFFPIHYLLGGVGMILEKLYKCK